MGYVQGAEDRNDNGKDLDKGNRMRKEGNNIRSEEGR